jgi:hypothetical protein
MPARPEGTKPERGTAAFLSDPPPRAGDESRLHRSGHDVRNFAGLRKTSVTRELPVHLTAYRTTLLFTMSANGNAPWMERVANHVFSTSIRSWWSQTGSNRRPPACKAGALPTELWPLEWACIFRAKARRTDRTRPTGTKGWWAWIDSNDRPHPYQGCALTT